MDTQLKLILIYDALFIIIENFVGYFLLWHLLGIIGIILTFSIFSLFSNFLPFVQLLVSPFVDRTKNKLKILKFFYILDFISIISLYPLFLYIYSIKGVFILLMFIISIFVLFIKSIEYATSDVIIRYLMKDYERETYTIREFRLVALAIGAIGGSSLLFLNTLENLNIILGVFIVNLLFLFNINIDLRINSSEYRKGIAEIFKKSIHEIIENNILRKILISEIAYSLPNAIFTLLIVYLVYYSFHLPPILIGLTSLASLLGGLLGNKIAYKIKINNKILLYFLYIIPDALTGVFILVTNPQRLPLVYVTFFVGSIFGSIVGYYYLLATYKLIPQDIFATTSSTISVTSSIASYVFTVIGSIIVSLISYQWAVILSLLLFIALDVYFVPFFVNVIRSVKSNESK